MKITATTNLTQPHVSATRPWSTRSLICLIGVLALCGACNDDDDRYSVEIEGQAALSNDAKVRIQLFGIDANIADAPASLIDGQIFPVISLPELYELNWPRNAESLIQNPPVNPSSQPRFYLFVTLDVDGDGMLCQGDLVRDRDATPSENLSERPTSTITVVMKEQEADVCRQFSYSVPVIL